MNCYIKIALTAAFCLTLGGCGLTNPYEKWLDECQENPDRIRPSEVKTAKRKHTRHHPKVYKAYVQDYLKQEYP